MFGQNLLLGKTNLVWDIYKQNEYNNENEM